MKCCRICGEEKEDKEFYKLKYFYRYIKASKVWCRDCMRLYVQMKDQEKRIETFLESTALFIVSFK